MKKDVNAILDLIKERDRFVITSHVNPDGDSISSQLALRNIFLSLGKSCRIVNHHNVPRIYRFLSGAEEVLVRRRHSMRPYSALFVLDCGHPSRASGFLSRRNPPTIVNFDHHVTNTRFGDFNWVDEKASSTSEVIFDLARLLGVAPDREIATKLRLEKLTGVADIVRQPCHFDLSAA